MRMTMNFHSIARISIAGTRPTPFTGIALTPHLLPLAAPFLLLAAACAGLWRGGRRPPLVPVLAEAAALGALLVALASLALLVRHGAATSRLIWS